MRGGLAHCSWPAHGASEPQPTKRVAAPGCELRLCTPAPTPPLHARSLARKTNVSVPEKAPSTARGCCHHGPKLETAQRSPRWAGRRLGVAPHAAAPAAGRDSGPGMSLQNQAQMRTRCRRTRQGLRAGRRWATAPAARGLLAWPGPGLEAVRPVHTPSCVRVGARGSGTHLHAGREKRDGQTPASPVPTAVGL